MLWKPIVAVICFMLLAISIIVFGAYRLTDNTCGIDKASFKKAESVTATDLDDAISVRPTDSAIRNYWLLRERIAESEQMILGLQTYINTECLR